MSFLDEILGTSFLAAGIGFPSAELERISTFHLLGGNHLNLEDLV
jgi:hypothetical protein